MGELFDDIARVLAGPLPRRRAIFRAAGLLAGAALAGLRPAISQADTVCCDPITGQCCPPNIACCGPSPTLHGRLHCCGRGQTCCNPATGLCCSQDEICCRGKCLPHGIPCCHTDVLLCGRICCPDGQTCCDPRLGLCCPAGQVCIVSGGRHLCGQPCGNPMAVPQTFCVNGECCINGLCQSPQCCAAHPCTWFDMPVPAKTAGSSPNLNDWVDTGIDLIANCGPVTITAMGTANYCNVCVVGPNGSSILNCTGNLAPKCGAPIGALIGKIGNATSFVIGSVLIFTPTTGGRLRLAFNDLYGLFGDNSGNFTVTVMGPCA